MAVTGNDGADGSAEHPWKTIGKAAERLGPGDAVRIGAGTYHERVIPKASGALGQPIVYASEDGAEVVLDGTGIAMHDAMWGGLFEVGFKTDLRVSGITVVHSGAAGIFVHDSERIVIDDDTTRDSVSSGIGVWKSRNVVIEHSEVELACNDGSQECISVAQTSEFEIRYNHVHHGGPGSHGGEGIDAKDGSSHGRVYGNLVHDTTRVGIYVDAWDKHLFDIEVFGNVVRDCGANGYAISTENGGLLENVRVYDNLAFRNRHVGLTVGAWGEKTTHAMNGVAVVNNTLTGNGIGKWGGGLQINNPEARGIVIRNNVVAGNLSFQFDVGKTAEPPVIDHNLVFGNRGGPNDVGTVEADPLFVNAAAGDFHLKPGSPALDVGSNDGAPDTDFDGQRRPAGPGFDLGAFERR